MQAIDILYNFATENFKNYKIMRKVFLLILSCFLISTYSFASLPVYLKASKIDNSPIGNQPGKSPIAIPHLFIDGYTLLFELGHPSYLVNIKDENGDVVYTTTVYSSQTQVTLPSTLSGDYTIELIMGNWLFTGYINL